VSRAAARIVFALLAAGWFAFSVLTLLIATLGDCRVIETCTEVKDLGFWLVVWRWIAGCLILFGGYRMVRKGPDVH